MNSNQTITALQSFLESNLKLYLQQLEKMVAINSFTENPEGINALGELTAKQFRNLGLTPTFVPSRWKNCGKHLVLEKKGTTSAQIGLVSHLDTVYTKEEETRNRFHWRQEGHKIYGPGTIDIKGGTVAIYMLLHAIQELFPSEYESIHWTVLLDASEEDDATDFGELCLTTLSPQTQAVLVFESGAWNEQDFLLVIARKGRLMAKISVEGKSSHAGTSHSSGANAILQLAKIVQEVEGWTDYDKTVTVNVGRIEGGTVANRVPHAAFAILEMRAFDREHYEETKKKIFDWVDFPVLKNADNDFQCKITVELIRETSPWPRNEGTNKLFSLWQQAGLEMGMKAIEQERGGLSDGNLICHQYPVIDGLGPSGANAHCSEQSQDGTKEQEYLDLRSLIPKTIVNTLAVLKLIQSLDSTKE